MKVTIRCLAGLFALVIAGCGPENNGGPSHCTIVEADGESVLECDDGTSAVLGGGETCTVEDIDAGALVTCPDGTTATLSNGNDGNDGSMSLVPYAEFAELLVSMHESVISLHVYDGENELLEICNATKTLDGGVVIPAACRNPDSELFFFYKEGVLLGDVPAFGNSRWFDLENRDCILVEDIAWNETGELVPGLQPLFDYQVAVGEILGSISYPYSMEYYVQTHMGQVTNNDFESIPFRRDAVLANLHSVGPPGAPIFNVDGEWVGIHVWSHLWSFEGEFGSETRTLEQILPFRSVE